MDGTQAHYHYSLVLWCEWWTVEGSCGVGSKKLLENTSGVIDASKRTFATLKIVEKSIFWHRHETGTTWTWLLIVETPERKIVDASFAFTLALKFSLFFILYTVKWHPIGAQSMFLQFTKLGVCTARQLVQQTPNCLSTTPMQKGLDLSTCSFTIKLKNTTRAFER